MSRVGLVVRTDNDPRPVSRVPRNVVRSAPMVIPDVTGATLRKAIAEQVDLAATDLHIDDAA